MVGLMEKIGSVTRVGNDKFGFAIDEEHYVLHKPHTKDLPTDQVAELRHFVARAGWTPGSPSQAVADPNSPPPSLVVVVDHHRAKIYRVNDEVGGGGSRRQI